MPQRRRFDRPLGERRYRKLFVIAAEGAKTEQPYFAVFNDESPTILVKCLRSAHDSASPYVLKRMTDYLKKEPLKEFDEAWLVIDKDRWTDEQLTQLHQWSQKNNNHGFALSNPNFEYWLLLHFDDGTGITGPHNCSERLGRRLPNYDKGIESRKISRDGINDAIRRAKQRDNPPCTDWPRAMGSTTVYRLVENILKAN